MGQEIGQTAFSADTLEEFRARLRSETKVLKSWFDGRRFDYQEALTGGLEVEAWLVDRNHLPAPRNDDFLATLGHPLVVPELSQFNFEINTEPHDLQGDFLSRQYDQLSNIWDACRGTAQPMGLTPMVVGILPTVRDQMLQPEAMSPSNRYKSLNEELFRMRNGQALHIEINGDDELNMRCDHLMIEAACTSIQVHLQVNQEEAKRLYNASMIVSAPLVACSANSPFLYGKALWSETRIPAFEQAVSVCSFRDSSGQDIGRVSMGGGYVRHSLLELFLENLNGYPVLLPALNDDGDRLAHLRLHNGAIWRWNRPIIGFDDSGSPHLRIEQRVMAAGPTLTDIVANIALYSGLALHYGRRDVPPEEEMHFEDCRTNFYNCARDGLQARIRWLGYEGDVQSLLLDRLLPEAKQALLKLGLDPADVEFYFDQVLRRRLLTGRNGAEWQRSFVNLHGYDFQALTARYAELQESGEPVHAWTV